VVVVALKYFGLSVGSPIHYPRTERSERVLFNKTFKNCLLNWEG
jgi:hypothetical protein